MFSEYMVEQVRQAGLRCIVTYTESTKNGKFSGAERIVSSLGESPAEITVRHFVYVVN
jgi:hypothetical protein